MEIRTDRTIFHLDKNDPESVWALRTSWKETEQDLCFLEFSLDAAEDLPPPELIFPIIPKNLPRHKRRNTLLSPAGKNKTHRKQRLRCVYVSL